VVIGLAVPADELALLEVVEDCVLPELLVEFVVLEPPLVPEPVLVADFVVEPECAASAGSWPLTS
jgi:hypothetical protein